MKISVVIPAFQAAAYIPALMTRLGDQTVPPAEIIIIDSSSTDGTVHLARELRCAVTVIPKADFNHGRTRNLGAKQAHGDVIVFMTQDALPANDHFLEELIRPIEHGIAKAAYARHLPYADAPPPEGFARYFNYPPHSHLRTITDVARLGIKAYFFSNVASAVDATMFWSVGGFSESVILNEDMLLCAEILRGGHAVAYQSEAKVFHSHRYTLSQQFKRYFDVGVAMAQAGPQLAGGHAGGEGIRFAAQQLEWLVRHGAWRWLPRTVIESLLKYMAFHLGKRERYIPNELKRKLSMHAFYWA